MVKHKYTALPYSHLTYNVMDVLSKKGYVGKVELLDVAPREKGSKDKGRKKFAERVIRVGLLYTEGVPHLNSLRFVSTPGKREYVRSVRLHRIEQGFGDVIVSTPKGIMDAVQAKKIGVGGEIICEVF